MTTLYQETFRVMGSDLKRYFRERRELEATRLYGGNPLYFMVMVEGFVMARHPNATPIVMSESEWRALPPAPGADGQGAPSDG